MLFFVRIEVFKTDFAKIIKHAEKRETFLKVYFQKERLLFVQNTFMEIAITNLRWGL